MKKQHSLSSTVKAKLNYIGRETSTRTILMHTAIGQKAGLSATDMKCLDLIDLKGSVTAGEIAQVTGLTTGAVTSMIDRLEKKGAVRRQADLHDRRKVIVVPEPAFFARFAPIYAHLAGMTEALYRRYTPQEQELIAGYIEASNEMVKQVTEEIRQMKI